MTKDIKSQIQVVLQSQTKKSTPRDTTVKLSKSKNKEKIKAAGEGYGEGSIPYKD